MTPLLHIAGTPAALDARTRAAVDAVAALGRERFAPRAPAHDRDASFPRENFDDLRGAGLLALGLPDGAAADTTAHRGAGAACDTQGADARPAERAHRDDSLRTTITRCAWATAEAARHCGATGLGLGMHLAATLWPGVLADALDLPPAERAAHAAARRALAEAVARDGRLFSQPFAEAGAAAAGKAPWATRARAADGGWRVSGCKVFASGAGSADLYAVPCTLTGDGDGAAASVLLAVPADAAGIRIEGDWDVLGMRGTASRTLVLDEVFVPASGLMLPPGREAQAAQRLPHVGLLLSAVYLGLAQAAWDFTVAWLRAEVPGMAPVKRRPYPTKQLAVAEMRVRLEQARAAFATSLADATADPDDAARMRLYAAHYTVVEHAPAIAALALRTCGARALSRTWPLERIARDARCGALMLPWTAELCLDHLGRESLYAADEGDEAIE